MCMCKCKCVCVFMCIGCTVGAVVASGLVSAVCRDVTLAPTGWPSLLTTPTGWPSLLTTPIGWPSLVAALAWAGFCVLGASPSAVLGFRVRVAVKGNLGFTVSG